MPKVSRLRRIFIKLTHWEYWPFSVVYFPIWFYYGWLSLRCRSLFFFTASNPSIEFGGMIGEKKSDIFKLIPSRYLPTTVLISKGDCSGAREEASKIGYPLIAKPDVGERGNWVKKIHDEKELDMYCQSCPVDFLLQGLVTYPVELGVFFVKLPGEKGKITSIVRKEFLAVEGDGTHTVNQLLKQNPRAVLTADLTSDRLIEIGETVPEKGEKIVIEPIGNHCRGTKFLNDNHEIDEQLTDAINEVADQIPDLYFGRFDLKCQSFEHLRNLQEFKIMELNGAGAEPGHIYQPGFSLLRAYKVICWHLSALAQISRLNHKRGVPYWSFKQGYRKWADHQKYNRLLSSS